MELPQTLEGCHELIRELMAQVLSLSEEVKRLRAQLDQNSGNSSKPSSSDGFRKKIVLPKKKGKGKKSGGQVGHKGHTLEMVAEADEVVALIPDRCECGESLAGVEPQLAARRQVFDLPVQALYVREYQSYECRCPKCRSVIYQPFPKEVSSPVQYGSGVKALVALLNTKFHLSWQRTSELFLDLYGYSINDHTQEQALSQAYERLAPVEAEIKAQVAASAVVHADETGVRTAGKLHWVHSSSTADYTYVYGHEKRGREALGEASILPGYSGTLVHDCWAPYFSFEHIRHALCGAHLVRELQGLKENGSRWAARMQRLLFTLHQKIQTEPTWQLTPEDPFWRRYDLICKSANKEEPPPIKNLRGKPRQSKGRNLYNRLSKFKSAVLLFATQTDVPFTNNQAERDIRPLKVKQKNAGCFRTKIGLDRFCRIYSFLSTLRKRNRNALNALTDLFEGKNSFFPLLST